MASRADCRSIRAPLGDRQTSELKELSKRYQPRHDVSGQKALQAGMEENSASLRRRETRVTRRHERKPGKVRILVRYHGRALSLRNARTSSRCLGVSCRQMWRGVVRA